MTMDTADPGYQSPSEIAGAQIIGQPLTVRTLGVYPAHIESQNPYWGGYAPVVVDDAIAGHIYALRFYADGLNGGKAVDVSYTAVAGDTADAIATQLCEKCRGNALLVNPNGLPILFWKVPGPGFNIQPHCNLGDSFAVSSIGTGKIAIPELQKYLDFAVTILGRNIPGYRIRGGDCPHALQWMTMNQDAQYALIPALISVQIPDAINGHGVMYLSVMQDWNCLAQWGIAGSGTVLFGPGNEMPNKAYMGAGWFNAARGIAINGVSIADEIQALKDEIARLKAQLS